MSRYLDAIFEARYGGHCDDCDESIKPGDPVTYSAEFVVHADCQRVRRRIPEVVCDSCWLTKPCDCEES